MRGGCIGMDYELCGHIIGIYRSGERGGRLGRGRRDKAWREKGGAKKSKEKVK